MLPINLIMTLSGIGIGANFSANHENSWAFLVAGSKGFNNYRHQADVSHAYHVMIAKGFHPSKIIVMMYDDIANHPDNKKPGVIQNRPLGPNVYEGLKIDYRGRDVNAKNFLHILSGDHVAMKGIGSERVIQSDGNSNIFVYFSDHGGPGILCFPDEVLYAVHLQHTLKKMYKRDQYKKVIMYIEACYSGSMFDNILEENTNVFVMTAAARDESSFGAYCDSGTCLGDEFSVRWLELMEKNSKSDFESFFHQYQYIRSMVKRSHVQIYGDLSIGTGSIIELDVMLPFFKSNAPEGDFVNSKNIALHALKTKIQQSKDLPTQKKASLALNALIEGRKVIDQLMNHIVNIVTYNKLHLRSKVRDTRLALNTEMFPCYMELLNNFKKFCFGLEHEYLIHQYHKLSNICVLKLNTSNLLRQLPSLCYPFKATIKSVVL